MTCEEGQSERDRRVAKHLMLGNDGYPRKRMPEGNAGTLDEDMAILADLMTGSWTEAHSAQPAALIALDQASRVPEMSCAQ